MPGTAKLAYLGNAAISAATGMVLPELPGLSDHILRAVGVEIGLGAFAMGLCFAVAGGFVAMAVTPPADRMAKWATLLAAALIGVLAAILHPSLPLVNGLPVQAVMGLAGLASRNGVDRVRQLDFSLPWKAGK